MLVWMDYAPRLRRAIANATEEAAAFGCPAVAIEHLLIAICKDRVSAANYIFEQAAVGQAAFVGRLRAMAPTGAVHRQRAAALSPSVLELLDSAGRESERLGHHHVGTEHVAIALAADPTTPVGALLAEIGLTHDRVERAIEQWLADGLPRQRSAHRISQIVRGLVNRAPSPLRKLSRLPMLAWNVYIRKSLGHPRFVTRPYPQYRWLRTHAPVRRDPIAPVWVLSRHADVAMMLKDSRFNKDPFASDRLPSAVREQLGVDEAQVRTSDVQTLSMLFLDPPQHTRVRAIFSRAFTPKMIAGLRPRIEQITLARLAEVRSLGKMEVIAALAYPLPVVMIAELLGFPPEDYAKYKKWSDDFAAALGINPSVAQQSAAAQSRRELHAYFDQLVARLLKAPGDNLLSALLAMENEAGALDREELFINSALLLAAGHETTTNLIGNGTYQLLRHRAQLEQLRSNPDLIERAVEELLRFDSPVQWVSRVVAEPIELSGQTLERGDIVLGSLGSANRDPAMFADPETLDLNRAENKHLSFGTGHHFCLGAALARMEAQIAIGAMVRELPRLRLARQRYRWKKGLIFRALRELHVTFAPA